MKAQTANRKTSDTPPLNRARPPLLCPPRSARPPTRTLTHFPTMPPPRRPSVLVTNDDGIHAPGLRALVAALAGAGLDVFVASPSGGERESQRERERERERGRGGVVFRGDQNHPGSGGQGEDGPSR